MPRTLAVLLVLALVSGALRAAPEGRVTGSQGRITADDLAQIRAVIARQIDAARGDAPAGCAIQRPSRFAFRDLMVIGDEVVQQVELTGRSGEVSIAYYAMQRQADGGWRAGGCRVVQPSRVIHAALEPR